MAGQRTPSRLSGHPGQGSRVGSMAPSSMGGGTAEGAPLWTAGVEVVQSLVLEHDDDVPPCTQAAIHGLRHVCEGQSNVAAHENTTSHAAFPSVS